jgi:hypothetical protein
MSYIEIEKREDGILLKLTPAGREELKSWRAEGCMSAWTKGTNSILCDLLEDHLANGWEFIYPAEIGALTDSLLISDEAVRSDQGHLTELGTVYWFPDYAVRSELDDLYDNGEVFFTAAKEYA